MPTRPCSLHVRRAVLTALTLTSVGCGADRAPAKSAVDSSRAPRSEAQPTRVEPTTTTSALVRRRPTTAPRISLEPLTSGRAPRPGSSRGINPSYESLSAEGADPFPMPFSPGTTDPQPPAAK